MAAAAPKTVEPNPIGFDPASFLAPKSEDPNGEPSVGLLPNPKLPAFDPKRPIGGGLEPNVFAERSVLGCFFGSMVAVNGCLAGVEVAPVAGILNVILLDTPGVENSCIERFPVAIGDTGSVVSATALKWCNPDLSLIGCGGEQIPGAFCWKFSKLKDRRSP